MDEESLNYKKKPIDLGKWFLKDLNSNLIIKIK